MPGRGRRASTAAFFALLAVAGCGGSDEPSEEEYVEQGNVVCERLAADFARLGAPPALGTPRRASWEMRVQVLTQKAFADLSALEPPDGLREERAALLAAAAANRRHLARLRLVQRALVRELRNDVTDGPAQAEYQDLAEQIRRDGEEAAEQLRAIGWTECVALTG